LPHEKAIKGSLKRGEKKEEMGRAGLTIRFFVTPLADIYPQIKVHSKSGNHGRIQKGGEKTFFSKPKRRFGPYLMPGRLTIQRLESGMGVRNERKDSWVNGK